MVAVLPVSSTGVMTPLLGGGIECDKRVNNVLVQGLSPLFRGPV